MAPEVVWGAGYGYKVPYKVPPESCHSYSGVRMPAPLVAIVKLRDVLLAHGGEAAVVWSMMC